MATSKVKTIAITGLIPDGQNHNRGTEKGKKALGTSFQRFGAGRSVLLDRNNQLIAGNKATQEAIQQGITSVIVVETTGNQLVAVKRTDIDLDSKIGREMAIADNAVAVASIEFDQEVLLALDDQYGLELEDFHIDLDGSSERQDYEFQDVSQYEALQKVPEPEKSAQVRDARGVLVQNPDQEKEASVFPISILLSRNELNIWKRFKEESGIKSDSQAFILLLNNFNDLPDDH